MLIAPGQRSRSAIGIASFSFASVIGFDAPHSSSFAAAPTPNVVEGTVKTTDGRPVAGATIRIAGATGAGRGTTVNATTDSYGRYRARVPLGHYNVDGFADIVYEGQTYKQIWLDRGDAPCDRVMSDRGIVRNFTLRLSGPKRCVNGLSRNDPDAYNGGYITALTSDFPDDAVITFTLAPLGPLADGTKGSRLTITRTGAALKKGGGAIAETSFLHDIPLGRYRIAADVRYADGKTSGTILELRDGGDTSGRTLDIGFHANAFGGGIRPVGLGLTPGGVARPAQTEARPATAPSQRATALSQPTPSHTAAGGIPLGRYECSYRSEYAGDIPTANSITILAGGLYRAYGGSGTYALDSGSGAARWTGPLGDGDAIATFGMRNGRPAITVVGGGAREDPGRTNYCVLLGS